MKKADKIDKLKRLLRQLKSKGFGKKQYADGLCLIMFADKENYPLEFRHYIYKRLPMKRFGPFRNYCWEPGIKAPRIKWINEQIKKLEGK